MIGRMTAAFSNRARRTKDPLYHVAGEAENMAVKSCFTPPLPIERFDEQAMRPRLTNLFLILNANRERQICATKNH